MIFFKKSDIDYLLTPRTIKFNFLSINFPRVNIKYLFTTTVFIISQIMTVDAAQAQLLTKNMGRSERITWLKRPWEIRYVLFVMSKSLWNSSKKRAIRENHDSNNKYKDFPNWQEFFDISQTIPMWTSKDVDKTDYDWVAISIIFDREGWVISPHSHPGRLRGRINQQLNFTLSEGDGIEDKAYDLGYWFMGMNEDLPMGITPGLCQFEDIEPLLDGDRNNSLYRYSSNYALSNISLFGCREWGYQLRAPFRPYVDVSSYIKPEVDNDQISKKENKRAKKHSNKPASELAINSKPLEAMVIDFIGWGDFEHHKPVIGQNLGSWYCFFECPNGEAPGPIDIESWTKRNGWRVPIPPTRMPVFPDDPNLQGDYPDAYNPLSD